MLKLVHSLIAPIGSLIIVMLGNGFFNTFVGIHLVQAQYTTFTISIIASSYFAGLLFGGLITDKLIAKVGFIRSFATFASFLTILLMINGLISATPAWIVIRFFTGVSIAGIFVVIESWLLLFSNIKTRGKVLSIYMTALYASHAVSQYLLGWIDLKTIGPFALVIILSSLSVIPVSMMRAESPTHTESNYLNPIQVLKASPLGFVSAILGGFILSSFYSLGPVFATKVGFSVEQIAQFMAMTLFGGLLLQWPIGLLSDLFNRKSVMIFVSFTCALVSLVLAAAFYIPTWALLVSCLLFGGFSFTIYPLGIALACDRIDPKNLVAATGVLLIAYSAGSIAGPLVASQFMNIFGPGGLYIYCALICMLLSAYASYRTKIRGDIKEHTDFIAVPRTTPVANELDPRSNEEGQATPKMQEIQVQDTLASTDQKEGQEGKTHPLNSDSKEDHPSEKKNEYTDLKAEAS
jgi:MFS family permease